MADLPIKVDTKGGPRGRTAGPMEVANRAVDPAEAETSPGPGLMLASIQGGGAPASRHCPSQTSVIWGAPRHIHLLIFAITHHIRTWGPTSTSTGCPHAHVLHVVSNTTSVLALSKCICQVCYGGAMPPSIMPVPPPPPAPLLFFCMMLPLMCPLHSPSDTSGRRAAPEDVS